MAEFTPLKTDFKDDILAESNTKRKYRQTFNTDGSVSLDDVTQYQQEGDALSAAEFNKTNLAINKIYGDRIVDLDDLELVTEPGFFVDALAVKEAFTELNDNTVKGGWLYNQVASAQSVAPSTQKTLLTATFTLDKPAIVYIQGRTTYSSVSYDTGQRQCRLTVDGTASVSHNHTIQNIDNYVCNEGMRHLGAGTHTITLGAYFSSSTGNNVNVSGSLGIMLLRYV